jgi:hypothetical protein
MKALTEHQQRILAAIDAGALSLRKIVEHASLSSTSVASYNVLRLAERGLIEVEQTARGLAVVDWRGFAAAWDSVARLAGNEEA